MSCQLYGTTRLYEEIHTKGATGVDTNTIGRLYQAGRNTVKKQDFDRRPITKPADESVERAATSDGTPADPASAKRATVKTKRRIENFLTETLAAVIWSDWAPMARVLSDAGVAEVDGITMIEPLTQQRVGISPNQGTVDLVLVIRRRRQRGLEIWAEIKAGAAEHGDQIANYRLAIERAADNAEVGRRLVVVAPAADQPIRNSIPISWQEVYEVAERSDKHLWRDFADFLVDQGLARRRDQESTRSGRDAALSGILGDVLRSRRDWPEWLNWTKGSSDSQRLKTLQSGIR